MIGALNEQMIEEILHNNIVGRLGYTDKGKMFITGDYGRYYSQYQPEKIDKDLLLPDKEKEIVYRIKIEERSGRFEKREG